jgi:large subunit ribosomal protein L4
MASELVQEVSGSIQVPVVNRQGESVGMIEVDAMEFGGKISPRLLHEAVLMYEANQRQGTHSTLRRNEVAGSTKKMFRQKGTGNARMGAKRTNKRRGGGTAKGPKPRDYSYSLPKKALRSATRMAILSKLRDQAVVVVDDLKLEGIKTKEVVNVLKSVKVGKKKFRKDDVEVEKDVTLYDGSVLIGTDKYDGNVYKSARNIEGVQVLPTGEFNSYVVLRQKRLVLTRDALDSLRQQKQA